MFRWSMNICRYQPMSKDFCSLIHEMLIQHAAGLFNNLIYLPNLTILISNINNWLRKSKSKSPIRAFTKAGRLRTWAIDCSPVSFLCYQTPSHYTEKDPQETYVILLTHRWRYWPTVTEIIQFSTTGCGQTSIHLSGP